MNKTMCDRITVDLDDPDVGHLIYVLEHIKKRNVYRIDVFRSPSGRGFHVIGHLREPISFKQQLDEREKLGDCKQRLRFSRRDLKRGFNPDVMFTHKKIDGEWKEEELLFKVVL